jgi:hypothetical protein
MRNATQNLLAIAAELRSGGSSWEAVAEAVGRCPDTCRQWPTRFREHWEPLLVDAQRRRFDEAGNEALQLLRLHMRDATDKKISVRACEFMLRYGRQARPPVTCVAPS